MQLWFELYRPPSPREAELLEELLASWFMLGRLGAYNAQNLQVEYCPASFCQAANIAPCQLHTVMTDSVM